MLSACRRTLATVSQASAAGTDEVGLAPMRLGRCPLLTCSVVRQLLLAAVGILLATSCSTASGGGIDVIDVQGPLDARALDFITSSIVAGAEAGQDLSVIQLNSRAVLDFAAFERLVDEISQPPLPVAVWVGPAPAVAYGGAALLPGLASQAAIAPGSEIGRSDPLVLGEDGELPELEMDGEGISRQPSIRQYLQALDGASFETQGGREVVSTVRPFDDGVTLKPVTFRKPGLWTRFLRLAVTPEAAFFFMMVGLSLVVFEFYALGPGVDHTAAYGWLERRFGEAR